MKNIILFILILPVLYATAQHPTRCEVYQLIGNETGDGSLVKTALYNNKGKVTSEIYKGYKSDTEKYEDKSEANYTYFYDDTTLTSVAIYNNHTDRVIAEMVGDSGKSIREYSNGGKNVNVKYYGLLKQLKPGRPLSCMIEPDDYEKDRVWTLLNDINDTYNNAGKIIKSEATRLNSYNTFKYIWIYDDKNRVKQHTTSNDSRMLWSLEYSYFDGGYTKTQTWYFDNKPRHLTDKTDEYWPQVFTYKLDSKGNEVEEICTKKDKVVKRKTTEYNDKGLVSKVVCYTADNAIELTHTYKYTW